MRVDGITPARLSQRTHTRSRALENTAPSFRETFAAFLKDVNSAQQVAGDAQKKFLAGETADVHQVMSASEEATVAFNLLMELRNKALDGYNEILRMRL
jgi:flagellar hook-basal body complex protein FliE